MLRLTLNGRLKTITSDKDQTIKVSVYGGEKKDVTFAEGETKTITFER